MSNQNTLKKIGLILSDVSASIQNSFLDTFSKQIQEKGYRLVIGISNFNLQREKELLQEFSMFADCIIVVSCAEKYEEIASSIHKDIPHLFLYNQPEECPFTCIMQSNYSALYQAIVSQANISSETIGCVCSHKELSSTKEFLKAYKDALRACSITYNDELVFEVESKLQFDAKKVVLDCAAKGCKCIMAASESITQQLANYLSYYNANTLTEPISLLGFGMESHTTSSAISLGTISHPTNLFVDLAVQQAIYLTTHPNSPVCKRPYLVKGKLLMISSAEDL